MSERKFDYEQIASINQNMQKIIGSKDNPNSIAGILETMDQKVHELINKENEAIYGQLGAQLLLDWENTSSNFNDFTNNFENWASVVAKSSGKYEEFENRVNGLKQTNSLGNSASELANAKSTSYYSNVSSNSNSLGNNSQEKCESFYSKQ